MNEFFEIYEIDDDDVWMRLFAQSLIGDDDVQMRLFTDTFRIWLS